MLENDALTSLPVGTVSFMLTDIEASTSLWESYPVQMGAAVGRHDALIERLVAEHDGTVVRPRGEGDSRFAVFANASDAVAAGCAIQVAFARERWAIPEPLRIRIALHTGESERRHGDYYGTAVNRCARLRAVAHGGQMLLSGTTADIVREGLADPVGLRYLGVHRLKDLTRPEAVYQITHPALAFDFPPLRSQDAPQHNLPSHLTRFVGREPELSAVKRLIGQSRLLTLLGTGGALKRALPMLSECFVVIYGDSYMPVDYPAIVKAFVLSGQPALMTILENKGRWDTSNVCFEAGEIRRYDKKQSTSEMRHIDYGVAVLNAAVFATYSNDTPFDLADVYSHLVSKKQIAAYEVKERFYEIGSRDGLAELDSLLRRKPSAILS